MNDIVLEWVIPHFLSVKQKVMKIVLLLASIALAAFAFLSNALFTIPAILLGAVIFFLFRSWKLEYEYSYVNGDLTISKIICKASRKDIFHCDIEDIQWIQKGRISSDLSKTKDFSSGLETATVYTLKTADYTVYIEPNEPFLQQMNFYRKLNH